MLRATQLEGKYTELIGDLKRDLDGFVEQRKVHDDKDDKRFKDLARQLYQSN